MLTLTLKRTRSQNKEITKEDKEKEIPNESVILRSKSLLNNRISKAKREHKRRYENTKQKIRDEIAQSKLAQSQKELASFDDSRKKYDVIMRSLEPFPLPFDKNDAILNLDIPMRELKAR